MDFETHFYEWGQSVRAVRKAFLRITKGYPEVKVFIGNQMWQCFALQKNQADKTPHKNSHKWCKKYVVICLHTKRCSKKVGRSEWGESSIHRQSLSVISTANGPYNYEHRLCLVLASFILMAATI